jgi:inorganic phosphate transporter, PiT family
MKVALPLVLSPIASLMITRALLRRWNKLGTSPDCVCAEAVPATVPLTTATVSMAVEINTMPSVRVVSCQQADRATEHPNAIPVSLDQLHWLTSAGVSFARGLNDAPKLVALMVASATILQLAPGFSFVAYVLIALGMLFGSLAAGRRVTTALAERVTPMNHLEAFVANLITALLVGPGAALGLPMSTTHVASGAIIAAGLEQHGRINWHMVRNMTFAWVITVPGAALLGIVAYETDPHDRRWMMAERARRNSLLLFCGTPILWDASAQFDKVLDMHQQIDGLAIGHARSFILAKMIHQEIFNEVEDVFV